MSGILGRGRQTSLQAKDGFSRVAALEERRKNQNEQIDAANDAAKATNTGTGAAIGYMAASGGAAAGAKAGSIGGPWGMAIGAVAGYLLSEWL